MSLTQTIITVDEVIWQSALLNTQFNFYYTEDPIDTIATISENEDLKKLFFPKLAAQFDALKDKLKIYISTAGKLSSARKNGQIELKNIVMLGECLGLDKQNLNDEIDPLLLRELEINILSILRENLSKLVTSAAQKAGFKTLAVLVKGDKEGDNEIGNSTVSLKIQVTGSNSKTLGDLLKRAEQEVFSLHQSKGGYSFSNVLKLMYTKNEARSGDKARSAVISLYLCKRINVLDKLSKRHNKGGKDISYRIMTDPLISRAIRLFMDKEFSSENGQAYYQLLNWRKKKRVTIEQFKAFVEVFIKPAPKYEINIPKVTRSLTNDYLDKNLNVNPRKNLWGEQAFQEMFKKVCRDLVANISDTVSRFRFFKAMYGLVSQETDEARDLRFYLADQMLKN